MCVGGGGGGGWVGGRVEGVGGEEVLLTILSLSS